MGLGIQVIVLKFEPRSYTRKSKEDKAQMSTVKMFLACCLQQHNEIPTVCGLTDNNNNKVYMETIIFFGIIIIT